VVHVGRSSSDAGEGVSVVERYMRRLCQVISTPSCTARRCLVRRFSKLELKLKTRILITTRYFHNELNLRVKLEFFETGILVHRMKLILLAFIFLE